MAAASGNTRNWQIKQDSSINDGNNGQLEPTMYLESFDCYILELQTKVWLVGFDLCYCGVTPV